MPNAAPQYRLNLVQPLSFVERVGHLSLDASDLPALTYSPHFGFRFDEEQRIVGVLTTVRVFEARDNPEATEAPGADTDAIVPEPSNGLPLAELEVACTFEFESWEPYRHEGEVRVPRRMVAQLVGIALSSVRGVLVGRTLHPIFQVAPLPLVSPIALVDDILGDRFEWVEPLAAA